MTTLVALYRGETITNARLVAVTADPSIVGDVAARLLARAAPAEDPVMERLESGRRNALRAIQREAGDAGAE